MSKFYFLFVASTIILSSNAKNLFDNLHLGELPKLPEIPVNLLNFTMPEIFNWKWDISTMIEQCTNIKGRMGMSFANLTALGVSADDLRLEYTSSGVNISYSILTAANDILADKRFSTENTLYVFVHGWQADHTKSNGIIQALYDTGRRNVLALDSTKYLKTWNYLESSSYVKFIGQKLAEVLIGLNEVGQDRKKIHIIGHSLGAQVAGFAGKHFKNNTGTKIGRISGLDPAGPCFSEVSDSYHLCKDDADFVDVIHSNAGIAGLAKAIGHVDFWPNGGTYQTGCNIIATCDHGRSMELYAESIRHPEAFPAAKCESWEDFTTYEGEREVRYMGFGAKPDGDRVEGSFYLRTNGTSSFSLGEEGLHKEQENAFFSAVKSFFG